MYELIILSLLMRAPMHGYLLAKITDDKIGPWARVSNGTLYPMLARLERDGSITTCDGSQGADEHESEHESKHEHGQGAEQGATDRTCRRYAITARGRQRFHALMLDTTSNLSDYQRIFRQKVPSLHLLAARERTYLLDHYRSYCEACILHAEREARDLEHKVGTPAAEEGIEHQLPALEAAIEVLGRQAEEWRAELAWARRLRERAWPVDVAPADTAQADTAPADIARMMSRVSMRPAERRGRFPQKRGAAAAGQEASAGTEQGGDEHAHA